MNQFDLSRFLYLYASFATLGQAIPKDNPVSFSEDSWNSLKKDAGAIKAQLGEFGLNVAAVSARRLEDVLDRGKQENGLIIFSQNDSTTINDLIKDIGMRVRDELDARVVIFIAPEKLAFYKQITPIFGNEVAQKFPSLAYEIEEAGKCLALDRSTASAFHSIRALEGAIRALARSLAIPDPVKAADRSWFKSLHAISNEMSQRWPTAAERMSGDGRFFEEAHAALAAMQNPYRNATMHLDQKYTEEEAKDILNLVKAFMRKLTSRLDEDGLPLA